MERFGADGGAARRLGRPRTLYEDARGAYGPHDSSNRLARGLQRKRVDMDPWTGRDICKIMVKEADTCADTVSWRKSCCRRYDKPWQQLQMIFEKGVPHWEHKVKTCKVGAGARGSLNKRGQHDVQNTRFGSKSAGVRASGGGRKDHFKEFKHELKLWVEEETKRPELE